MNTEVLVSTMNIDNKKQYSKLLKNLNIKGRSLVINQCPSKKIKIKDIAKGSNKLYSFNDKGLSKSRNLGIKFSTADICIIADDDLTYVDNYEQIILNAYRKYPKADIIAFYVESLNLDRKTSVQKEGRKRYLGSMKIASFQITFKRKSIIDNEIFFDEEFGAGSNKFVSGEENIFLFDCLKKDLKIYYVPIQIAIVNHQDSTWFKGYNSMFFQTLGAAFYRMSSIFSELFIFQYAIRKYSKYKKDLSFFKAYKLMKIGKKKKSFRPFFVGDFATSTGPSIVNKNIKLAIGKRGFYSKSKSKFLRIIELLIKAPFSDCLFFCSFSKLDVIGIKLAKVLNKKTFYLMHGRIQFENDINKRNNELLIKTEKYILDNVSCIVCVSKMLLNEVARDAYSSKTEYVYNCINYSDIIVVDDLIKEKNLIMSTGGLIPIKNNIIVCKAIDLLNKKHNCNLQYLLIGDDYGNLDQLKEYNFVKYIKHVSHQECLKYMKKSNIYIQNSLYETFGLAIVESIVNDCNLLISKNVGVKDMISTFTEDDIIYNPNDVNEISSKILHLLSIPNSQRIKKGINAKNTDLKKQGQQLLKVMEERLYE